MRSSSHKINQNISLPHRHFVDHLLSETCTFQQSLHTGINPRAQATESVAAKTEPQHKIATLRRNLKSTSRTKARWRNNEEIEDHRGHAQKTNEPGDQTAHGLMTIWLAASSQRTVRATEDRSGNAAGRRTKDGAQIKSIRIKQVHSGRRSRRRWRTS
jgi:hypothetical protein